MKTMVERVVDVLDNTDPSESVFRNGTRWVVKTPESVDVLEKDEPDREKERQRKELKMRYPKAPLRWNGRKWVLDRKKQTISEEVHCLWVHRQEQLDEIERSIEPQELNEISLRTVGIGGSVLKLNGWRRKVESGISKLRSLSTSLNTSKTPEQTNKILSDIYKVDGDVLLGLSKMILWSSGISVSGLLGLEKKLKKKLKTSKRR